MHFQVESLNKFRQHLEVRYEFGTDLWSGVDQERIRSRHIRWLGHSSWIRGRCGVAKTLVLGQGSAGVEGLLAFDAGYLYLAAGVHALVPAEVRELGVGLATDLTLERLDRAVDVGVLLEARARGEGLAALDAGVTSGALVVRADVALQVRVIREDLWS